MNLKERAKNLKTDIPAVFLALKDGKTPWYAKVLAESVQADFDMVAGKLKT